jgi:hypothetical protein
LILVHILGVAALGIDAATERVVRAVVVDSELLEAAGAFAGEGLGEGGIEGGGEGGIEGGGGRAGKGRGKRRGGWCERKRDREGGREELPWWRCVETC